MITSEFSITSKQAELMTTVVNAPATGVEEIFLIGAIGTSKTFAMAYLFCNVAIQFEDSIIPVARKDMAEASITTWPVFLECMDLMGLEFGTDYSIREATNDLRVKFYNDSIIQFIGLNKSRDRQWSKAKVTSTMAGIDEVDDVEEEGYDVLYSRTGRRNRNGAPRVMVSCCNPNDAWIRQKIYLPWLKRNNDRREGISDEEWNAIEPLDPKKVVIEFEMEDSLLYKTGYYDRFQDRPLPWRQRFLHNNWNYVDDEDSLFKARAMDTLTVNRLKRGTKYLGVDPNAGGNDRASIVMWEDDTIVDAWVYTSEQLQKLALPDERSPMNYGAILGRITIEIMNREGIGAINVAGDVVGIGQGWLTHMLAHGYKVCQFQSGAAPHQTAAEKAKKIKPPYFDLRSQMYAKWGMEVTNARVYFYAKMPHLAALKKELQMHSSDSTAKVQRVIPKDDLRKMLGKSPDIADSAMMGYWVRMLRKGREDQSLTRASVGKSVDEFYNSNNGF